MNFDEKIVITGTGRTGTSLLIQLFTHLKMKTGFKPDFCDKTINNRPGHAGLERNLRDLSNKDIHILKQPYFCSSIVGLVREYKVGHVIIPIRELTNSAKSRERVSKTGSSAGAFWGATNVQEQMTHNARVIYKLMYNLSRLDVPYTLVPFPQFTRDYDILYQKLNWLFEGYNIDRGTYNKVMDQVVDPKKIHKFD